MCFSSSRASSAPPRYEDGHLVRVAQPFDSRRDVGPPSSPDSLNGDHRTTFTTDSLFSRVPSLPALSTVNTRPYKRPLNKHQGPTLIIQLKGTVAFLGRPSAQCVCADADV
ncbi:hypothetical protein B0H13DRAFT_2368802 [Mycena leptocephala]|nr:hypothetical protein B0H13DRAFT_2368802 [Mycena leptocephala]